MAVGQPVSSNVEQQLDAVLANMTFREQLNFLLQCGMPAEDIMSIQSCREHVGGRMMHDNQPLSFEGNTLWCKGCWKWYAIW